ncbi:hypothetical protein JCGZ_23153 [Jatropha curcas]|uniref:Germin-like protein n=1 Tax=Jatropha curcas TaxID=180498 RepID=A0A067JTJ7_JATCU|nr:germin-like protein 5-1 [Jatropha curcas]KDP23320.1 hypothetical protein JCGZ_23153 [Jatropha curcas]
MAAPAVAFFLFTFPFVFFFASVAADPDLLQDVCAADYSFEAKLNGYACKKDIVVDDFVSDVIAKPGSPANSYGSVATAANVLKVPGLNTLGISMSRIDYAPGGLNPPHLHPRASEIIFVLEGELDVGFLTTNNTLIAKTVKRGEIFIFPKALVHYQKNNANAPASVLAAFNSQLPGTQVMATTLFAAKPEVPDRILSETFHVGSKEIQKIKSRFAPKQ